MKYLFCVLLASMLWSAAYGQKGSVESLYENEKYEELVKYESKVDQLTKEELMMVGIAFFMRDNDRKAIEFYDRAISKGITGADVHYRKGLALRYIEELAPALKEFEVALKTDPTNPKYLSEAGFVTYLLENYDQSRHYYNQVIALPDCPPQAHYMLAHLYHVQKEFDKALSAYYASLTVIPKKDEYYIKTLADIGLLEFTCTKDFNKSARAYKLVINADSTQYKIYPKLMKALNEAEQYASADSVFILMQKAFYRNQLPEKDMEIKIATIDEFFYQNQPLSIVRYFIEPKESLDISYKVHLFNQAHNKIERTFMIEQTFQLPGGPKHLLCELDRKSGAHYTYPYGWKTDKIPVGDLKKVVKLVLDGKMQPSASSNFGK